MPSQVYDPAHPQGEPTAPATDTSPGHHPDAQLDTDSGRQHRTASLATDPSASGRPRRTSLRRDATLSSSVGSFGTLGSMLRPGGVGAGAGPVQKFCQDTGRMMERVRAGQVLVEKVRAAAGGGPEVPGMMPAFDPEAGRRQAKRSTAMLGAEDAMVQVRGGGCS